MATFSAAGPPGVFSRVPVRGAGGQRRRGGGAGGRGECGLDVEGGSAAIEVEVVELHLEMPVGEGDVGHGDEHADVQRAHAEDHEGNGDELEEEDVSEGDPADAFEVVD